MNDSMMHPPLRMSGAWTNRVQRLDVRPRSDAALAMSSQPRTTRSWRTRVIKLLNIFG